MSDTFMNIGELFRQRHWCYFEIYPSEHQKGMKLELPDSEKGIGPANEKGTVMYPSALNLTKQSISEGEDNVVEEVVGHALELNLTEKEPYQVLELLLGLCVWFSALLSRGPWRLRSNPVRSFEHGKLWSTSCFTDCIRSWRFQVWGMILWTQDISQGLELVTEMTGVGGNGHLYARSCG